MLAASVSADYNQAIMTREDKRLELWHFIRQAWHGNIEQKCHCLKASNKSLGKQKESAFPYTIRMNPQTFFCWYLSSLELNSLL